MASITLTIPDAAAQRVINALCRNAQKPVSAANAKAALIDLIKQTVTAVEVADAIAALPPITPPDVTDIVT